MPKMECRRAAILVTLSLAVVTSLHCGRASAVRTIRLAHGLPASHPVHKAMEFMAQRVAEKSGGTLRIEIYHSGQLGSERECLELLQIGSLGMTKVSAAVMEAFAPAFRIFNLPYLFEDDEHRFAVLDGPIGQRMLLAGERCWLRGLCYYDAGFRSFYTTKRPIRRPEDLAGLKIRTQESPTAVAMVRAMGASATPVAWGELYTALQQGVVDGAENNPPSFYLSRHYEVCRYYCLDEHTAVPDVLLISTRVWKRLSEQQRRWLSEAAAESAVYQRKLWVETSEDAMSRLRAAGVEIIRPDKSAFAARVADMAEMYRDHAEVYAMVREIRAMRRRGQ